MKLLIAAFLVPIAAASWAENINPTDGAWFAKVGNVTTAGCPPEMGQQLQQAGPQDATFDLVWNGTAPQVGDYLWEPVGENQFRAVIAENEVTQMGTIAMQSVLNLTVLSETEMAQTGSTTITLSGQLAQLFESASACRLNHQVAYSYQG